MFEIQLNEISAVIHTHITSANAVFPNEIALKDEIAETYALKEELENNPTVDEANAGIGALKTEIEENYALKSEVEELKTTIQTLTERLAALESK